MKKKISVTKTLFFMTLLSYLSNPLLADEINVGVPAYGGSGCPAGSVGINLTPDSKAISILFDQFTVKAEVDEKHRSKEKSCNIAIPITVPKNLSATIEQVDYRGLNDLPDDTKSKLKSEYYFAGDRWPRYSKEFKGPLYDYYFVENQIPEQKRIWSECGKNVILRINVELEVDRKSEHVQAKSLLDSPDIYSGISYHFVFKQCNE